MKRTLLFLISILMGVNLFAQRTVTGTVRDARGDGVEYATVFTDSVVTLTDLKGHFKLEIPDEDKSDMTIRHISFQPRLIPYAEYASGNLEITVQDAVNELAEVTIKYDRKNRLRTISSLGLRAPGVCSETSIADGLDSGDFGPLFKVSRDVTLEEIHFLIQYYSADYGKVRVIIYEIGKEKTTPVISQPIYADIHSCKDSTAVIIPPQPILLEKGHHYFAGLSLVDGPLDGKLLFPLYFNSGYYYDVKTKESMKVPFCIGLKLLGRYQ